MSMLPTCQSQNSAQPRPCWLTAASTGENLICQELLGKKALKHEANRQQLRLEFFRQDPSRFTQYLNPQRPCNEYEVRSYLVTKHIPLAHRYKETRIVRAFEFLESEI